MFVSPFLFPSEPSDTNLTQGGFCMGFVSLVCFTLFRTIPLVG